MKKNCAQIIIIEEFKPEYQEAVKNVINTVMSALRPDYNPNDLKNAELNKINEAYTGKGRFWVAKDGNKIIGTVAIFQRSPEEANLKKLFLLKEYRGKGIGKKLLQHALDHCVKQSFKRITLITSTYAHEAQKLYHHFGFCKTDKIYDFDKTLIQYRLAFE